MSITVGNILVLAGIGLPLVIITILGAIGWPKKLPNRIMVYGVLFVIGAVAMFFGYRRNFGQISMVFFLIAYIIGVANAMVFWNVMRAAKKPLIFPLITGTVALFVLAFGGYSSIKYQNSYLAMLSRLAEQQKVDEKNTYIPKKSSKSSSSSSSSKSKQKSASSSSDGGVASNENSQLDIAKDLYKATDVLAKDNLDLANTMIGRKIPILSLVNIQGQQMKTTDLPNVYLIYQTTSAHSGQAVKAFSTISADLKDHANFIYMFPMGENADQINKFFRGQSLRTPDTVTMLSNNLNVTDGTSLQDVAIKTLKITSVPAIFIADKTGTIQFTNLGATDSQQIKNIINIGLGSYTQNK